MTKLRELVNEAGVTIYDVGCALRITPSTVYQMADGKMPVNKHVVKLAEYFSVTTDLLFDAPFSFYVVQYTRGDYVENVKVGPESYSKMHNQTGFKLQKTDSGIKRILYLEGSPIPEEMKECQEILDGLSNDDLKKALAVLEAMFK